MALEALLYFLVAITASTIGAISGIGGGIIIKPVLDGIGALGIPQINFLSGCTVLAMTIVSLLRSRNEAGMQLPLSLYLAGGGIAGGVLGRHAFARISVQSPSLAIIQSSALLFINVGVLLYVLNRQKIRSFRMSAPLPAVAVGIGLGFISSFLGIGGGPLNIAVLRILFSMKAKETALNSLFIILFSQCASLVTTILAGSIPAFDPRILAVMGAGGISGAFLGRNLTRRMSDGAVERLFLVVLVALVGLNLRNFLRAL